MTQNWIVFGPDPPRLSMRTMPDGSTVVIPINEESRVCFLPTAVENRDLRWEDLLTRKQKHYLERARASMTSAKLFGKPIEERQLTERSQIEMEIFENLTFDLIDLTGSEAERVFFQKYIAACLEYYRHLEDDFIRSLKDTSIEVDFSELESMYPLKMPALMPQVWVNWIHFDSRDQWRAERVQLEPFRVDFAFKVVAMSNHFSAFEIDGTSHFGSWSVDAKGSSVFHPSLEAYTQHLRKDRWLRKQGWNVFRLSNQEVKECDDFVELLYEITGIPFFADRVYSRSELADPRERHNIPPRLPPEFL